jgi:mRNA interferase HigB
MKVFNKKLIDEFTVKHADSVKAIDRWINTLEQSVFVNHNELKSTFPSADYVGNNRYVFNIKGNNYRIVAVVLFTGNQATVCFVGTHAEYNKVDCSTVLQ